jgi:hypothetical protein
MGFGLPCWVWFTHARRLARPAPPPPTRCPVLGLAHLRAGRVRSDPGLEAPPTTTTHRGARDDAWRLRLRRHKETEERAQRWRELLRQQQARRTRVVVVGLRGWREREREHCLDKRRFSFFLLWAPCRQRHRHKCVCVFFFGRCCMGSGSDM